MGPPSRLDTHRQRLAMKGTDMSDDTKAVILITIVIAIIVIGMFLAAQTELRL